MAKTSPLQIRVFAQTNVGMVRQGNEDNFIIVDLESGESWSSAEDGRTPAGVMSFAAGNYGPLVAVSDGMGGALAGEVASTMAVVQVRDQLLSYRTKDGYRSLSFAERFRAAIEVTNLIIHRESLSHQEYAGMGATFTGATIEGKRLYLGQIGDSRAYLIRRESITQLTKDQSLVGSLIEAGHLTEVEAETHAYRNVILQALGATKHVNVDMRALDLRHNDIVLLCSDGLSGKVRASEMLEIVTASDSLVLACQRLIHLANEYGGDDNITVAMIQVDSPELQSGGGDDDQPMIRTLPRDPDIPDGGDEDDTDEIVTAERPPGDELVDVSASVPQESTGYVPPLPRQFQIDPAPSAPNKIPFTKHPSPKPASRTFGILLIISAFLMLTGIVLFKFARGN